MLHLDPMEATPKDPRLEGKAKKKKRDPPLLTVTKYQGMQIGQSHPPTLVWMYHRYHLGNTVWSAPVVEPGPADVLMGNPQTPGCMEIFMILGGGLPPHLKSSLLLRPMVLREVPTPKDEILLLP